LQEKIEDIKARIDNIRLAAVPFEMRQIPRDNNLLTLPQQIRHIQKTFDLYNKLFIGTMDGTLTPGEKPYADAISAIMQTYISDSNSLLFSFINLAYSSNTSSLSDFQRKSLRETCFELLLGNEYLELTVRLAEVSLLLCLPENMIQISAPQYVNRETNERTIRDMTDEAARELGRLPRFHAYYTLLAFPMLDFSKHACTFPANTP
jgi:hypothetical protein